MTDGCGLKGDPIESPETLESINEKFNKIFRKKCVCNEGHFLPFNLLALISVFSLFRS